jgi:hypothetical protein
MLLHMMDFANKHSADVFMPREAEHIYLKKKEQGALQVCNSRNRSLREKYIPIVTPITTHLSRY